MKKLKAKIEAKLKSRAGESLGEVLIALLISALALTMLASVIASSSKIITQTKEKMATYYAANDKLSAKTSGAEAQPMVLTITVNGAKIKTDEDKDGEFEFIDHEMPTRTSTYSTHLTKVDSDSQEKLTYYVNSTLGDTKVISFKKN